MENGLFEWLVLSSVGLLLFYLLSKKFHWSKQVLIILFLSINAIYLGWRAVYTLPTMNTISIIAGVLLLLTEVAGFLQSIVFSIISWRPFKRKHVPLSKLETLPTVDIFIATYNESEDLLKRTIAACTLIRYPKNLVTIYVCDDGRRSSVRELCEEFGISYIDRKDNSHAKAGNLNHALTKSSGEIVVTMDADMVPQANFLERTVGHFSDEEMVFVQAPQVFYNDDPFQYNLFFEDRITNEQDFFMRQLEQGKDRFNATMYVGSNALFRRTALDEVGGFATGVITEDMATGMLLQSDNRKSAFVNETLAVGLSPETYADLLKQRDRWCRGNIQVVRKWNPLKMKGLSFMQKLLYMDGIHYWFFGIYKMVFLLAPLLFLVFNIYSLDVAFDQLLWFWIPAFISSQLMFKAVADKKRTVMWSHVYEVAMAPYMAMSVLSEVFLKKKFKFNVTRKGVQNDRRRFLWVTSLPYLFLAGLTAFALVKVGLYYVYPERYNVNLDVLYINIFWVLYNAMAIILAVFLSFERPRHRNSERFSVDLQGVLNGPEASVSFEIVNISESGARIELDALTLQSYLSNETEFTVSFAGVKDLKVEKKWINQRDGKLQMGLTFTHPTQVQYAEIIRVLFSEPVNAGIEKYYEKAYLTTAMYRFLKRTKKADPTFNRQVIRENVTLSGQLHVDGQTVDATVLDYSEAGCSVRLNRTLRVDQIVKVTTDERELSERSAKICWVRRKGRSRVIGLKFVA
ncbi:glycosyltransferase [Alkalicoccobacillus murimartini]|uniref:cellulose synthase (UDP-forming) n=1 Tax=Alkalicoccobacillus murimartini TaxID=171685 RepID=A0ABT9YKN4_9BACI|nr:glycosyltransferase [Alkalicoccobacillus murimartini]MDQ0207777.1 cellulose synthase (UDP-forming) [Alkalicoccobacillus murimartini]